MEVSVVAKKCSKGPRELQWENHKAGAWNYGESSCCLQHRIICLLKDSSWQVTENKLLWQRQNAWLWSIKWPVHLELPIINYVLSKRWMGPVSILHKMELVYPGSSSSTTRSDPHVTYHDCTNCPPMAWTMALQRVSYDQSQWREKPKMAYRWVNALSAYRLKCISHFKMGYSCIQRWS